MINVLRSMTADFDYIVVSIEQSKNLVVMKVEVLQASLEAHEMRLEKRNSVREKVVEQAMQARFTKMFGKEKLKMRKNHANDDKSRKNSKNHFDSIKKVMSNKYSGKKVDVKEVQCYNCQGFGHYARDFQRKKEFIEKDDGEVQYAHARENDSNDMLLMENTQMNDN